MRKLIRILIKSIIVLALTIITVDAISSYIRYRNYYKQESVHHPLLESVHSEYSVKYLDSSIHKMNEIKGKVKLLYWHSGCPSSIRWFPRIKKIADVNPDSVEVFFITEQSTNQLGIFSSSNNIHICRGAVRVNEKLFKHSSSSHIVILDKKNRLKAYGYQLDKCDSIIHDLTNDRSLSPSLSESLKYLEKEFQINLKNRDNYSFNVTGYDKSRKASAIGSYSWINYINYPIGDIYRLLLRIPDYRIIDLTGANIRSDSSSNKYCVYHKTKNPFAPLVWQIFFDNKEKRREIFAADLQKRLDKALGLKSEIVLKSTPTLILKKITSNKENQFNKIPQKGEYLYDVYAVGDTVRWNYNLKTDIRSITNAIEQVLKMPVQTEYESSDKYRITLSFLNNKKFTNNEIIADLRKQGLSLNIENREVEYLEVKNAADN